MLVLFWCTRCCTCPDSNERSHHTREMADAADEMEPEGDLLSEASDTESDEDNGQGEGIASVSGEASEAHKAFRKGMEKAKRRKNARQRAADLDATCEEEAHEEGLLLPRTLAELHAVDAVLWEGQELSCRAEFCLKVAEDCEKQQRFYTACNQRKFPWATKAGRPNLGTVDAQCVCREDKDCAYFVKVCVHGDPRPCRPCVSTDPRMVRAGRLVQRAAAARGSQDGLEGGEVRGAYMRSWTAACRGCASQKRQGSAPPEAREGREQQGEGQGAGQAGQALSVQG